MTLRIILSSAAYDQDEEFLVDDTPAVRRALDLRQQIIDLSGDGHNGVSTVHQSARHTEQQFIDFILLDVGNGIHDDACLAYIQGKTNDEPDLSETW